MNASAPSTVALPDAEALQQLREVMLYNQHYFAEVPDALIRGVREEERIFWRGWLRALAHKFWPEQNEKEEGRG